MANRRKRPKDIDALITEAYLAAIKLSKILVSVYFVDEVNRAKLKNKACRDKLFSLVGQGGDKEKMARVALDRSVKRLAGLREKLERIIKRSEVQLKAMGKTFSMLGVEAQSISR